MRAIIRKDHVDREADPEGQAHPEYVENHQQESGILPSNDLWLNVSTCAEAAHMTEVDVLLSNDIWLNASTCAEAAHMTEADVLLLQEM